MKSPASSWIVSPAFDLGFFHASALSVVLVFLMSRVFHSSEMAVMVLVGVASNGPHLSSTWTCVYLDRRELSSRPFAFVGVPLLIAAALVAFIAYGPRFASVSPAFADPPRVFDSIILYWASWHFAAQCYGLSRLYQRRSAEPWRPAHRVENAFIFACAASGLLWRLHFGPTELFGSLVLAPPIPLALVVFSVAAVAACALVVAIDQLSRVRAGGRVAWTRLGFLLAVLAGFWIPFMAIRRGSDAFFAAACWHGLQYLGIVYFYNRNKHGKSIQPGARLVGWVSRPGRGWAYAALLLALAGGALVLVKGLALALGKSEFEVGLVVWTALTLGHYYVDGLIWKLRKAEVQGSLEAAPA